MAQLTIKEFEDVVSILANHLRFERLHERLLKANALVSRKRPSTPQALASQLFQLSAGLRRNHPARYAVELLWQEMLSENVTEEHSKMLESIADRVNACLTERLEVVPEKGTDLLAALGAYHQAVATLTNDEVAYLEVLLRASTDVARFLREHKDELLAVGVMAESEEREAESEEGKAGHEKQDG